MLEFANRILCIEDDRETAALIAEDLSERGYDVGVAYDGGAGFAAIMRLNPSLVLCDLVMPTSGFQVLRRLRQSPPRFRATPFILLSGMADRDVESTAKALGAHDVLTKPVDFDVLASIIGARLARVRQARAAIDRAALRTGCTAPAALYPEIAYPEIAGPALRNT